MRSFFIPASVHVSVKYGLITLESFFLVHIMEIYFFALGSNASPETLYEMFI